MNAKSEQLTPDFNIKFDYDQPMAPKELQTAIIDILGKNAQIELINDKKIVVFTNKKGEKYILLTKAITYLGNPHPLFKKRIQIPKNWIEYSLNTKDMGYDLRFIGVYQYEGLIVFVDFNTESYLTHNCNNSAAHVYINDLYQGAKNGFFQKRDRNNNIINVLAADKFKSYLEGNIVQSATLECFEKFNETFLFGKWLSAEYAIKEMFENFWPQWRQAEWPGWYLEFRFSEFVKNPDIASYLTYTGLKNKNKNRIDVFDFDIWFPLDHHYGDLKASDLDVKKSPGNDKETFKQCLQKYGRFWYVIYEHETIKDRERDFKATRFRNKFIHEKDRIPLRKDKEMSYCNRMKNSVRFRNMFILELNPINFHSILNDFNQGHQPNGTNRNPKFLINKSNIENFIIYRYNGKDGNE